jgi:hypothetical protein
MRTVGWMVATLALVVAATGAHADDIYRWTDRGGSVHYSNTPSNAPAATTRESASERSSREPAASAPDRKADAAGGEDTDAFFASASLRRNALERDFRATRKEIDGIDAKLGTLKRAREQHAQGSAATGGVGANLQVQSEEERALAARREDLTKHATEIQTEAGQLRTDVTTHAGGTTPAWWIDVR